MFFRLVERAEKVVRKCFMQEEFRVVEKTVEGVVRDDVFYLRVVSADDISDVAFVGNWGRPELRGPVESDSFSGMENGERSRGSRDNDTFCL